MAQQHITHVGSMTLRMFGDILLQTAFTLAEEAQQAIEKGNPEVFLKDAYDGTPDGDIALSIDRDIQRTFVTIAERYYPKGIGLFGEENGLRRPSTLAGPKVVVTVDPVDGTKLLEQTLSAGRMPQPGEISVMLGILVDGVAVGGCICDIVTLEACMRFPYGESVRHIVGINGDLTKVSSLPSEDFHEGMLLWHGTRAVNSPLTERLIALNFGGTGQIERPRGSIGLCATRVLTDRKIVGLVRPGGGTVTAWDDTSIAAFSATDLVTLKVTKDAFVETVVPLGEPTQNPGDLLYISKRHLEDLEQFGTVQLLT